MFRTTLANLSRRKLRLLATSLAVLLGVMFTAGTLVLTDSLGTTFSTLFSDVYGQTSAIVRSNKKVEGGIQFGNTQTRGNLPDTLVAEVEAVDGVVPALEAVRLRARPGDRVVVFGSFLTVGPALVWLGIEV